MALGWGGLSWARWKPGAEISTKWQGFKYLSHHVLFPRCINREQDWKYNNQDWNQHTRQYGMQCPKWVA